MCCDVKLLCYFCVVYLVNVCSLAVRCFFCYWWFVVIAVYVFFSSYWIYET